LIRLSNYFSFNPLPPVYSGEKLFQEYFVGAPATALGLCGSLFGRPNEGHGPPEVLQDGTKIAKILYGTDAGAVGCLKITSNSGIDSSNNDGNQNGNDNDLDPGLDHGGMGSFGSNRNSPSNRGGNAKRKLDPTAQTELAQMFVLPTEKRKAGVTQITTGDIGQSGVDDVCVCREDGTVEIWSMGAGMEPGATSYGPGYGSEARCTFETCIGENIRAADVGTVTLGE
jgi:hypothetical protein